MCSLSWRKAWRRWLTPVQASGFCDRVTWSSKRRLPMTRETLREREHRIARLSPPDPSYREHLRSALIGRTCNPHAQRQRAMSSGRFRPAEIDPIADTSSQRRPSILGKALLLSNLDDDFPFCTSLFDVSHRLFGRFKWADPVQDRAYGALLDERTDLSQLIPACSHEEKGIVDLMTLGLSSDPEA